MIPELIISFSRGITVLNIEIVGNIQNELNDLHRNPREITFRLTNVIPERIIFVSRGITVLNNEIVGNIQHELNDFL